MRRGVPISERPEQENKQSRQRRELSGRGRELPKARAASDDDCDGNEGRLFVGSCGSQGRKEGKARPVVYGCRLRRIGSNLSAKGAALERLKRLPQHRAIFLPVVAEPPFPQGECANAIIGDRGLAVGDDVFDRLSGPEFYAASEELLRRDRSNARLLVVARLPRDSFTDHELRDVHIPAGKALFVTRAYDACGFELVKIRIKVARFGENREDFVLHLF